MSETRKVKTALKSDDGAGVNGYVEQGDECPLASSSKYAAIMMLIERHGVEWVVAGEGVATRKFDGTSCLFQDGRLWKRYNVKKGRPIPEGWIAAQDPDPQTGHHPGWLPVGGWAEDKWHREGWDNTPDLEEGVTYELCGPKVQGNIERFDSHILIKHGDEVLSDAPRTFEGLRQYLDGSIEGIVWHHPDGRMVKIKAKDFGVKRR